MTIHDFAVFHAVFGESVGNAQSLTGFVAAIVPIGCPLGTIQAVNEVVVICRAVASEGSVGNAAGMVGGFFVVIRNGSGNGFVRADSRAFRPADAQGVVLGVFRDAVGGGLQAHFRAGLTRRDGQRFADIAQVAIRCLAVAEGQRESDGLVAGFI